MGSYLQHYEQSIPKQVDGRQAVAKCNQFYDSSKTLRVYIMICGEKALEKTVHVGYWYIRGYFRSNYDKTQSSKWSESDFFIRRGWVSCGSYIHFLSKTPCLIGWLPNVYSQMRTALEAEVEEVGLCYCCCCCSWVLVGQTNCSNCSCCFGQRRS